MNGYEINAAVKAGVAARQKLWLAGLGAGAEVGVKNYGSDTTAVVSRVTTTQIVLSSGQRVNKDSGLIRGAGGYNIYEPGAAEIECEERKKVTAAAELLAESIAYSLSEVQNGRNNEPLAVGDAVVTADYYKRTGVVVHIYNNGGVIVDFSKERGQGTYAKSDLCKLLDPVAGATGTVTLTIGSDDDGNSNLASTQLSVTNGTLNASLAGGATIGAGSSSPPRRRAPGAGRPRLVAPTKQVFGRIPLHLLPELERRGGATLVLIDALSPKKLT